MAKQTEEINRKEFYKHKEGWYRVAVEKIEKRRTLKSYYRIWTFRILETGKHIRILLFPWETKELILALGGVEIEGGKIEWDDEEVLGRQIEIYIHYQQENNKEWLKLKEVRAISQDVDDIQLED